MIFDSIIVHRTQPEIIGHLFLCGYVSKFGCTSKRVHIHYVNSLPVLIFLKLFRKINNVSASTISVVVMDEFHLYLRIYDHTYISIPSVSSASRRDT